LYEGLMFLEDLTCLRISLVEREFHLLYES